MVEPFSVHAFGIGESLLFMLTKALRCGTAFDIFYDTIDAADFLIIILFAELYKLCHGSTHYAKAGELFWA